MRLVYYKNLDGVRGIAALMVMFYHFFLFAHYDDGIYLILEKLSVFGQTGVTLFFVLSGFLITRILMESKNSEGYFKNFYIRRSLRIFPLYYLFLILTYYAFPLIFDLKWVPIDRQLYYFFYLQNWAITFDWKAIGPIHFWSLAVEEHFYLFWPFLVFYTNRKRLFISIIGIISIAMFLRWFMHSEGIGIHYFTFTRFDALALGALLSLLEVKEYLVSKNAKYFLFSGIFSLIPTIILWLSFSGEALVIIQVVKYLLLSLTYFSFIGFVISLSQQSLINQILNSRLLNYTGKISYGLYVYHPFIFHYVNKSIDNKYWIVTMIVSFVVSYLISSLSFNFFESYFLKLKDRFTTKKPDNSSIELT